MKKLALLFSLLCSCFAFAQTTISGNVKDENSIPIPGANIVIVGTQTGTVTDFNGDFKLTTSTPTPLKIKISSVGFGTIEKEILSNNETINVSLQEGTALDEIVISASRSPERIFESPVTVELLGLKEIKTTPSADFYDGLENLKGVDINTNSLTFKSVNTRGFSTFANNRFMQLVDGMDNSTPALNFPIGNIMGMTETDVLSVELLPGASSALYGANAFNGILFMRSKSPFDFSGISVSLKQGVTKQIASGTNPFTDVSARFAYKFSDYFAAKVNFGYLSGTDWAGDSADDKIMPGGTRVNNPNYDGINIYGDEVSTNIKEVAKSLERLGVLPAGANALVPSKNVSRTGYRELDLNNNKAESVKADWGLYYRPWANSFEIQYVGKVGTGSTIYQGTNRYSISNFFQQQHKIEIKNNNFFVRTYVVADKAGDSYDMVFTGININRSWKDDRTWFGQYTGAFVQATFAGASEEQAHNIARNVADTGRYLPGSPEFKNAFDRIIKDPDLSKGSRFKDASSYYHTDANYNFNELIEWAEIQVGGAYRKYNLNSSGTLYTDKDGPIDYSEYGLYTQIQKNMELSDALNLKLTGSIRYDKSEFFDGFFSPRVSAGLTVNKNHNFRASVQTGFRNPTTQDLFIGLDAGRAILVGAAPTNLDRWTRNYAVSSSGQAFFGQPSTVTITGRNAYENSYTAQSVQRLAATGDPSVLEVGNPDLVKPEQITTGEIGYRGKINKFVVDLNVYFNSYKNFLSQEVVIAPFYGKVGDGGLSIAAISNGDFQAFSTYTNSPAAVNSYGGSIGVSTKILGNYDLGANYTYAKLDFDQEKYPNFITNFNTPNHKFKATFGNTEVIKNLGFNVAYRFSDKYYWEATFGNGNIPAFHVVDAQINYNVPTLKSVFKVGGTNITGKEYYTAFGSGHIGSLYYVSWVINN